MLAVNGYNMGQRQQVSGSWNFERLTDKTFRLDVRPDIGIR